MTTGGVILIGLAAVGARLLLDPRARRVYRAWKSSTPSPLRTRGTRFVAIGAGTALAGAFTPIVVRSTTGFDPFWFFEAMFLVALGGVGFIALGGFLIGRANAQERKV